ncbi:unnamed protein product [Caretta caretta]
MLVVVKKGCHAAQYRDLSGIRDGPYLPIYSHTRFCNASLCNHRYWDNCHIPAFPTGQGGWFLILFPSSLPRSAPDNTSASLWCYACIGTTPESCSLRQAQQSRCYDDSPRCFDGTGMATIDQPPGPIYSSIPPPPFPLAQPHGLTTPVSCPLDQPTDPSTPASSLPVTVREWPVLAAGRGLA